MPVWIVRLGTPRLAQEGLRIGTVRWSHGNFSVGCYCKDESRCHRSLLRDLLIEGGAEIG